LTWGAEVAQHAAPVSHDSYAALRIPEYRAFLGAMGAAFLGTQIQSAVLGWQMYALTRDPLTLGFVGLAEALPFLALTLIGGWAADRADRRLLSLASLALVGASGAWLLVLSLGAPRSALPFYGAQALAGVGRAFFRPTSLALGAELVPREQYHNLTDGIRFVFRDELLLGAMSLDMVAVLFGGATALLPVFARDVLRVDEVGFGILRAAPAAGSVLMSVALARSGHFRRAGRALLGAVACFGVTWIAFALSRSYALSLALLALGGAFDNVSVVLRTTLVQTLTPQDKMGRVAAVSSFFIGSSNEIGAFESGVAARQLGVVPARGFGGAMTLATVGLVAWRAPALRRLTRIRAPD
jgi:hypothetical protein